MRRARPRISPGQEGVSSLSEIVLEVVGSAAEACNFWGPYIGRQVLRPAKDA